MHLNSRPLKTWGNCLRNSFRLCARLTGLLLAFSAFQVQCRDVLSEQQLQAVGQKIYFNETGGNKRYLVTWNEGEAFASLGIGHFIWFPTGLRSRFSESFPKLVAFFQSEGVPLPEWLNAQTDCPWQNQAAFIKAENSQKMRDLRELLQRTQSLQAEFMLQRMQRSLGEMSKRLENKAEVERLKHLFTTLATTELGLYTLIDYVNFKGEGTSLKERYQGKGWGLMQVLNGMNENINIHDAFSQSCKNVLQGRVQHSPQKDREEQWLKGWFKRCESYGQIE